MGQKVPSGFSVFDLQEYTTAKEYEDKGDYDTAREWYHKALAVCERDAGAEHRDTALVHLNIGATYNCSEQYAPALEWFIKGYRMLKQTQGDADPYTCASKIYMQDVYAQLNFPEPFNTWFNREFT